MYKVYFSLVMLVLSVQAPVFGMDYTAPGCKRSLIKELGKLHNAILKARTYPGIPEHRQDVEVKRHNLKVWFPQEVEALPDGRVKVMYITASGDITFITR